MGAVMKNGVNYSGGSSGTNDYVDLINKPAINGVTLAGNKSSDDLGIITKVVNDLVNYYNKTDSYSKAEVDTMIAAAKNGRFVAVATLPTTDIQTNVIYLVPSSDPETGNVKDEYINLDGTTAGWEKIGNTDIDLALSALSDVNITSPTDNQVLKYNSTSGKWENGTGGGGSTYTAGDGIEITNDVISTKQSEEGDIDKIIDVYPTAGNLVSIVNAFNRGDLYSTDEKMIGQWIDGKPLYQKVLNIGNLPNNTEKIIELSISDFEKAVYVDGISCDLTSSVKITRPIPYIYTPETQYSNALWLQSDNNVWNIHIKTGANRSNEIGIVTIKYTKTTDTAISIGEATEYSTEEKVIGTWIDGKPVYQKTINFGALPNNTNKMVSTGVSNLDRIYNVFGWANNASETRSLPYVSSDGNYIIAIDIQDTDIRIITKRNYSDMSAYVTIQYTKTT